MSLLVHFLVSLQPEWCVSVSAGAGRCHLLMLGGTFELRLPSPSLAGTSRQVFGAVGFLGQTGCDICSLLFATSAGIESHFHAMLIPSPRAEPGVTPERVCPAGTPVAPVPLLCWHIQNLRCQQYRKSDFFIKAHHQLFREELTLQ